MSLDLDLNYPEFNLKMGKSSNNKVYEFEDFRLDAAHLMLSRGQEEIPLAPKAVETLLVLVEQRGKILSKDELMEAIWADSIVEESNLAQYLHVLRKTLGKLQNGQPYIETLRRRGYRFNGEVTATEISNGDLPENKKTEAAVEPKTPASEPAFINPNPRPLRVERHGNVIAVADWQEPEAKPEPVINAQSEPPAPLTGAKRRKRPIYAAVLVCSLLVIGAVAFLWYRSQSYSAQATSKDDVLFMNLTDGEDVNEATISSDGNYLVYSSQDGEKAHLWLQQIGQPSRLEIVEPFAGHIYGTSFTTDSQFVYFVVDDNRGEPWALYRVPTLGGVKTKILTNLTTPVSFSPDGKEMVFMRADTKTGQSFIVIASSEGKHERILLTRNANAGEGMAGGGAWSPDGKFIAYGQADLKKPWTGACTIVASDVQTGEVRPLSTEKWDTCYRMEWTRDGEGLVFVGTKSAESFSTRRDQIYYLSIANGQSRRLTVDGNRYLYSSLGVTARDDVLAVSFNRMSQIWAMDALGDSRSAVQITKGFADGRGGIAPLNDGRVAYLTRNGDGFSIWTMNADGSNRKQLITNPPAMQELRSPPDGSYFVFSAKRDEWDHLYRFESHGGNLRQLTFGDTHETDSAISPDGKWIVYDSVDYSTGKQKTTLWKISSDGVEPRRLTDTECGTPHFSPAGTSVSCVSLDWKTIYIVSVETGERTATFKSEPNAVLNTGPRWTPDGKSLAYIVNSNQIGNIVTQPVNGEAPKALTDFQSGDIYNFAFSTDGTRLYLARGYQTKKAVLIKNFR